MFATLYHAKYTIRCYEVEYHAVLHYSVLSEGVVICKGILQGYSVIRARGRYAASQVCLSALDWFLIGSRGLSLGFL